MRGACVPLPWFVLTKLPIFRVRDIPAPGGPMRIILTLSCALSAMPTWPCSRDSSSAMRCSSLETVLWRSETADGCTDFRAAVSPTANDVVRRNWFLATAVTSQDTSGMERCCRPFCTSVHESKNDSIRTRGVVQRMSKSGLGQRGTRGLNHARACTKQERLTTSMIVSNLQARRVVSYMCTTVNTPDP